jgi:trk system potassium uptake protein TrkH
MVTVRIHIVLKYFSAILAIMSLMLGAITVWSGCKWLLGDPTEGAAFFAIGSTSIVGLVISGGIWLCTHTREDHFGRREAILLVSMGWVFGSVAAASPYFVWAMHTPDIAPDHPFQQPVNCYFEAMSGLTTTGATVLKDIEACPGSLVLWRSTTHWLGGLGIVLLFAALLPQLGVIAKKFVWAEAGAEPGGNGELTLRQASRGLWLIYSGITGAGIVALHCAGMNWFDSVNHAVAALATGGFSNRNANAGAYSSCAVHYILIVLMVLGGVNFALYYQLCQRRFSAVWRNKELRFYIASLVLISTITAVCLLERPITLTTGEVVPPSTRNAIEHGLFNAVSMHTDTGFATADFDQWPMWATGVILLGTFVGGSMGSTTGGLKVMRLLLTTKIAIYQLITYLPSKYVHSLKYGKRAIDQRAQQRILCHAVLFSLILCGGTFVLMVLEQGHHIHVKTAATAALATLCTAGPGLARVGPIQNYAWFTASSKLLMCLLMVLGRLEIFSFLAVFVPAFWRAE